MADSEESGIIENISSHKNKMADITDSQLPVSEETILEGQNGGQMDVVIQDGGYAACATNDLDLTNDNLPQGGASEGQGHDLQSEGQGQEEGEDDTSLEVNFGGGDSCRVSDVSSLSFQNIILDDTDNDILDSENIEVPSSRRDSAESSDSMPSDFPPDFPPGSTDPQSFSGALQHEIMKQSSRGERGESDLDRTLTEEDLIHGEYEPETSTIKRKGKGASVEPPDGVPGNISSCPAAGEYGIGSGATEHAQTQNETHGGGSSHLNEKKDFTGGRSSSPKSSASNALNSVPNNAPISREFNDDIDTSSRNRPPHQREVTTSHMINRPGSLSTTGNGASGPSVCQAADHSPTLSSPSSSSTVTQSRADSVPREIRDNTPQSSQPQIKKRNSLEVRNNIPNVNQVKSYDMDALGELNKFSPNVGAVPKMKKKSPGLARRLNDSDQSEGRDSRETSSSEKEVDPLADLDNSVISAQKMFEQQLKQQLRTGGHPSAGVLAALNKSLTSDPRDPGVTRHQERPASWAGQGHPGGQGYSSRSQQQREPRARSLPKATTPTAGPMDGYPLTLPQDGGDGSTSKEIENEYDYVKYARIQSGDSYVGMRLAYSTSDDSLKVRNANAAASQSGPHPGGPHPGPMGHSSSGEEEVYFGGSSRETSPEKKIFHYSQMQGQLKQFQSSHQGAVQGYTAGYTPSYTPAYTSSGSNSTSSGSQTLVSYIFD